MLTILTYGNIRTFESESLNMWDLEISHNALFFMSSRAARNSIIIFLPLASPFYCSDTIAAACNEVNPMYPLLRSAASFCLRV